MIGLLIFIEGLVGTWILLRPSSDELVTLRLGDLAKWWLFSYSWPVSLPVTLVLYRRRLRRNPSRMIV